MATSILPPAIAEVTRNINAERDDPCAAYKILMDTFIAYRNLGAEIPTALYQIQEALNIECEAESQGR